MYKFFKESPTALAMPLAYVIEMDYKMLETKKFYLEN